MSFTSQEVNYLVYRYLQESGYVHSAFAFSVESGAAGNNINGSPVPTAALLTLIQKGLMYAEAEQSFIDETHERTVQPLSLFDAVLPQVISGRNECVSSNETQQTSNTDPSDGDAAFPESQEQSKTNVDGSSAVELSKDKVTFFHGHEAEVFFCAWNPKMEVLASISADSTARIWNLIENESSIDSAETEKRQLVLRHCHENCQNGPSSKDVTSMDWNSDGTLLATGSYDGYGRIWTVGGKLISTLVRHEGPIFALKWNRKGNCVLSAGADKKAVIWYANSGQCLQEFAFHSAPVLDVDWKSNTAFASCSTDHSIHVCGLGFQNPTKTFTGHQKVVNAIKWDPQGQILASCSDDKTLKIWTTKSDTCLHDLNAHQKAVYSVKWSLTGPGTSFPNQELLLASASFDATVRLWNVERGVCLRTLSKHRGPVYSVAFSPDGRLIASGSSDMCIYVWDTNTGSVVLSFTGDVSGPGRIFDVSWNSRGDRLGACATDGTVMVLDALHRKSVP